MQTARAPSGEIAEISAVPSYIATTTPFSTVATVGSDVSHIIAVFVASDGVTVAVSAKTVSGVSRRESLSRVMFSTVVYTDATKTAQDALFPFAVAVTVAEPTPTAVTVPFTTVTTDVSEEVHSTSPPETVTALTVARSVYVSFSLSWSNAALRDRSEEDAPESVTVTVQISVFPSAVVAVTVAVPTPTAVTVPSDAILATFTLFEDHTTVLFVAFSGAIFASSPKVSPTRRAKVEDERVTREVETYEEVTVIVHSATCPLAFVAFIVVVPAARLLTTPFSTVATVGTVDVHVTVLSAALDGVTVAVSARFSPTFIVAEVLFSVIPVAGTVAVTVTAQDALLPPAVAVIVAVPAPFAVTTPPYTVATLPFEVDHTTVLSVAFDGFTVAIRVRSSPTSIDAEVVFSETPVTGTVGTPPVADFEEVSNLFSPLLMIIEG